MRIMRGLRQVTFVLFLVGLHSLAFAQGPGVVLPPRTQPKPAGNSGPIPLERLSKAQFRTMPLTALLIYKGQTMSKADYMSRKLKEWGANKPTVQTNATTTSDGRSAEIEFDQKQQAELAARNAKAQAEFEKMQLDARRLTELPQYAALAKEAADLRDRFDKASPDEKTRIKQRATEVYNQLVQLEKNAALLPR